MRIASLHGRPLDRYQSNCLIAGHVNFLFKHCIPSIFNCLCIVWKHFHKLAVPLFLLHRKHFIESLSSTVKSKTYKHGYDVSMTSQVTKNIYFFTNKILEERPG